MTFANSKFARGLWSVRQTLFPSFEAKRYHLQFRHFALITMMLMCASFPLPAYHQTKPFSQSVYNTSDAVPVEAGYNLIQRFMAGMMYFNIVLASWIGLHLVVEPLFQRGAPVWFEVTYMSFFIVGELVCLGLMAISRPHDICDRSYPVVPIPDRRGGFVDTNSAQSVCSNWRGMTGLLAAIIVVFLAHVTWHVIVSVRHRTLRKGVLTLPITDYRWKLPEPLERVNTIFPGDVEKTAAIRTSDEKQIDSRYSSGDYSSKGTHPDTISFPASDSINEEYSNFSRALNAPKLQALPVSSKPVVLQQSIVTRSDTSSIIESDRAGSPQSPKEPAPFSYANRI